MDEDYAKKLYELEMERERQRAAQHVAALQNELAEVEKRKSNLAIWGILGSIPSLLLLMIPPTVPLGIVGVAVIVWMFSQVAKLRKREADLLDILNPPEKTVHPPEQ